MKPLVTLTAMLLLSVAAYSQPTNPTGTFSTGTRNTLSAFNHDEATGKGIGGQFRIQLGRRINSEWYFDYITSGNALTARNDYHIGWSLLFYLRNNYDFSKLLQPYLVVGHCFDNSIVFEKGNKLNNSSRLSMATQAGIGTHINITHRFDCSLTGQYMLHFGKDIEAIAEPGKVVIQQEDHTSLEGHLLFTVSFNYKVAALW
ncbi:MAG: hypothetical protein IPP72_00115 [Chitinophagaceae bacterium]|nr:hypothetical protein [Chitinophagaceae bacterium]